MIIQKKQEDKPPKKIAGAGSSPGSPLPEIPHPLTLKDIKPSLKDLKRKTKAGDDDTASKKTK